MLYGAVKEITLAVQNPPKEAVVRMPTADEWLERMRTQKSIRKDLGCRRTRNDISRNPKADSELFKKIQVSGDEMDEYEAERFIGILQSASVITAEREGDGYAITLKWRYFGQMEGETVHHLRIPTLREMAEYRRGVVSVVDLPYGQQELRYHITAAVELYDKLVKSTEGYSDGTEIPPVHKAPVITELIQLSDAQNDTGSVEDEEGFQKAGS
jgi:hypothetical protein